MSEYTEVEQPFLQQLAAQGRTLIDPGTGVPQNPALYCMAEQSAQNGQTTQALLVS